MSVTSTPEDDVSLGLAADFYKILVVICKEGDMEKKKERKKEWSKKNNIEFSCLFELIAPLTIVSSLS